MGAAPPCQPPLRSYNGRMRSTSARFLHRASLWAKKAPRRGRAGRSSGLCAYRRLGLNEALRSFLPALALSLATALAGCAPPTTAPPADADASAAADTAVGADALAGQDQQPGLCSGLDNTLRVNHLQVLGTHNSYHLAKTPPPLKQWAYSHDPLATQLQQQGVRAFELDLHHLGSDKPIAVHHIQLLDELTTCATLAECLQQLRTWSDAHPCHHPLFVTLEAKDDLEESMVADHLGELESQILAVWPKDRLVKPDDVRRSHPSVLAGLQAQGWPTLAEARGKLTIILYNNEGLLDNYRKLHPAMQGAVAFVFGPVGDPDIATLLRDNPQAAGLPELAKQGYVLRTFPDPTAEDSQAALASGAHIISTDHPVEKPDLPGYSLQLPGGAPSRCNPAVAPATCTAAAINAGVVGGPSP